MTTAVTKKRPTPPEATKLGNLIRKHRLETGLNKAELARLIGVSDVSVTYWERGQIKQIGHERLGKLAQVLGIDTYALLDIDEGELFRLTVEEEAAKQKLLQKLRTRYEDEEGAALSCEEIKLLVECTSLKESFAQ